jgi:hypothetical protein
MPILNFPSNPSIGQTHVIGTTTYQWNGSAWVIQSKVATFNSTTVVSLTVTTTTNAVSVSSGGALTVAGGGAIAGNLYVGGNIVNSGGQLSSTTGTFGRVIINGGTQSNSTNTGALTVVGGIGISGNLFIGGTLFSQGAPVLTTASFNNTPQDGTDIDIVDVGGGILEFNNISTLQSVTLRGSTTNRQISITNSTASTSTNSGALTVSGGVGVNGNVSALGLNLAQGNVSSSIQTVSTTSATIIDSYYFSQYRSAKYIVQISEGTGLSDRSQTSELLTVAFNTGTSSLVEYATVFSSVDLGSFDTLMNNIGTDTVVSLYYIANDSTPKTIKIIRTLISK